MYIKSVIDEYKNSTMCMNKIGIKNYIYKTVNNHFMRNVECVQIMFLPNTKNIHNVYEKWKHVLKKGKTIYLMKTKEGHK